MPDASPNILIIIADQLARHCVGAYGNQWVRTPNIDSIARHGVRFDNTYCTFPLCGPSRASFWTSRYPHETGIVSNGGQYPCGPIPDDMPTLGSLFREAGYECVHFGKTHDGGSLRGFDVAACEAIEVAPAHGIPLNADTYKDERATRQSVDYLERGHDQPFLMVADLQNPHNICGWVGETAAGHKAIDESVPLPPLPANFDDQDIAERPRPIQYLCCAHRRLAQASGFTDKQWRQYIAAYYHYTERVDEHIGRILRTLRKSDAADNTLVVFLSDHGDGVAAHRMATKHTSFYEEPNAVPLIFAGPGVKGEQGRMVDGGLFSLLDLVPTLCDCAEIDVPESIRGRSLMPWLADRSPGDWREYVVSQWHTEWGFTIEPGRMVRTMQFKYTRYLEENGEELYDLENDPGESRTLIHDPAYAETLQHHRLLLEKHCAETGDSFFDDEWKADPQWRSHPPGYTNHEGPSAPQALSNR